MTIYWLIAGIILLIAVFLYKGKAILDLTFNVPRFWWNMINTPTNLKVEKFQFGEHKKQYTLLFTDAEKEATRQPIIIYWHGGGWQFGKPDAFGPSAQFFVNQGFTVFMPSHRKMPFYRNEPLLEDAFLAVKKVLEVMEAKGWSDRPLLFGGMSSGGNLAALACFNCQKWRSENLPENRIKGIFLQAAPLDLNQMAWTPQLWLYAGNRKKARFKSANPIEYLTEKYDFPVLLSHGDNDDIVELGSSQSFYKKIKALNKKQTDLLIYPKLTHMEVSMWGYREDEVGEGIRAWLEQF